MTLGVYIAAVVAIIGGMLRSCQSCEIKYLNDNIGKWACAASFKYRHMLVSFLKSCASINFG